MAAIIQNCCTEKQVQKYLAQNPNKIILHKQKGKDGIFLSYLKDDKLTHTICKTDSPECLSDTILQQGLQTKAVVYHPISSSVKCIPLRGCVFGMCRDPGMCFAPVQVKGTHHLRFCQSSCLGNCYCRTHSGIHSGSVITVKVNGNSIAADGNLMIGDSKTAGSAPKDDVTVHILRVPLIHALPSCALRYSQWFCSSKLCKHNVTHYTAFDVKKGMWITHVMNAPFRSGAEQVTTPVTSSVTTQKASGTRGRGTFVVYTQPGCEWCTRAISCLQYNQCRYRLVPITANVVTRLNISETPHIYEVFNEGQKNEVSTFVGGYDQLQVLLKAYDFLNTVVYWKQVPTFSKVYNDHKFANWRFCGDSFRCASSAANLAQIEFLQRKGIIPTASTKSGKKGSGEVNIMMSDITKLIAKANA